MHLLYHHVGQLIHFHELKGTRSSGSDGLYGALKCHKHAYAMVEIIEYTHAKGGFDLISGFDMLAVFPAQTFCAGLFNVQGSKAVGAAVVAMLFLCYIFYNFAFNALIYSYPVEVLPYPIRAKGFSLLMFLGKAANFLNTFVNPIGLAALSWKYYGFYVGWLCIECLLIYLYCVETQGHSLEAILAQFDGDDVVIDTEKLEVHIPKLDDIVSLPNVTIKLNSIEAHESFGG
jgi:hypothetical protein